MTLSSFFSAKLTYRSTRYEQPDAHSSSTLYNTQPKHSNPCPACQLPNGTHFDAYDLHQTVLIDCKSLHFTLGVFTSEICCNPLVNQAARHVPIGQWLPNWSISTLSTISTYDQGHINTIVHSKLINLSQNNLLPRSQIIYPSFPTIHSHDQGKTTWSRCLKLYKIRAVLNQEYFV